MNGLLEDIGRRIAELRWQAGLTQEQLAAALGVNNRHVQRLEQGRVNVGALMVIRLAKALGVHPGELFEPSEHVRRAGRPSKAAAKKPAAKRTSAAKRHPKR